MLFCPLAQAVWTAVKDFFPLHLCREKLVNAKQWIFDFLAGVSSALGTVLAVTVWHIERQEMMLATMLVWCIVVGWLRKSRPMWR